MGNKVIATFGEIHPRVLTALFILETALEDLVLRAADACRVVAHARDVAIDHHGCVEHRGDVVGHQVVVDDLSHQLVMAGVVGENDPPSSPLDSLVATLGRDFSNEIERAHALSALIITSVF